MLFSPDLHRTGFGQFVAQDLVGDRRNVNPDLRERPVRPRYEPRPDPIGMALLQLHPGAALQAAAARAVNLVRRRQRAADRRAPVAPPASVEQVR